MENQLDAVTEKPTCFLGLQGLACDWSKHNKHSRNIFSVHGFLRLSVTYFLLIMFTVMVFDIMSLQYGRPVSLMNLVIWLR